MRYVVIVRGQWEKQPFAEAFVVADARSKGEAINRVASAESHRNAIGAESYEVHSVFYPDLEKEIPAD